MFAPPRFSSRYCIEHSSIPNAASALIESETYLELRCAWNWYDVLALPQEPRQRNLAGGSIMSLANSLEPVGEFEDIGEILVRVAESQDGAASAPCERLKQLAQELTAVLFF